MVPPKIDYWITELYTMNTLNVYWHSAQFCDA